MSTRTLLERAEAEFHAGPATDQARLFAAMLAVLDSLDTRLTRLEEAQVKPQEFIVARVWNGDPHEWHVLRWTPSEWGSEYVHIGDVDDCDTREQALEAGRKMWAARGKDYPCAD